MPQPPRPRSTGRTVVKQGPSPAKLLAAVPRRPMTAEQQLAAVSKVQQQADHRVKLGQQLFKAAEARLSQHQDLLEQVRAEQATLREQVQDDVAKSLQSYDQWMGRIDESFTKAIDRLGERIDKTERELTESRTEMQRMLAQVGAMMDQTQRLLSEAFGESIEEQSPATDVPPKTQAPVNRSVTKPSQTALTPPPLDAEQPDTFGQLLDQLREAQDDDLAA